MSEATIAEPPVEKAALPAPHPGAVTIDLSNLGKKPVPKAEVVPPDVAAEKVAADAKAAEVVDAAKAAEAAKKPSGDKEHNMAELRKAREAAEARAKEIEVERDRIKTEFEAFKTKAPELPEDVKGKLTKFEELEKEREEQRRIIRQLDLSRDPDFQAKYNKPIMDRISQMGSIAIAAGVPEAEWKAAATSWEPEKFAEWSEAMTPAQRVEFNSAWMSAVDIHRQQQLELQNADKAYQDLQKQRQAEAEAQQKQYFTQNEQLARSVIAETIKPETLKEYEDLGPAAERLLMQAARHEIPAKDIFQQLAANQVLARVTVKQAKTIEELQATLAERDKKISEQDAFIANQAGAVPRGDAAGGSAAAGDKTPLWKQIVVKT